MLLLSGVSSADEYELAFADRLIETLIGAALALTFGLAVPAAIRQIRAIDRAPQS